jgi:hypothetical protein
MRLDKQLVPFRLVKISALLLATFSISGSLSAEAPTDEVLKICRTKLSSERGAKTVERWSTRPLPSDYRKAAGPALKDMNVDGWIVYKNPNQISTVVIRVVDPETKERYFDILLKNNTSLTYKAGVAAFEFARSSDEHNGMIGLFFCDKHGPSAEWVWDGSDWKVAH